MHSSDEKLNQLLSSAAVVPSSADFSERIIAESKRHHIKTTHKEGIFGQILRSLIFPKPAYVFACSMLLGVMVGWQNPSVNMTSNTIQDIPRITFFDEELSNLFVAEVSYYE